MSRPELGSDICDCGDFRSQHRHENRFTKEMTRCFCGCNVFRFAYRALEADLQTWNKYHAGRAPQERGRAE